MEENKLRRTQMLKPEFKAAWLAALRSGEYQQTRGTLRDANGFCCLGVACDVALKMELIKGRWEIGDITGVLCTESHDSNKLSAGMPPDSVIDAIFYSDSPDAPVTAWFAWSDRDDVSLDTHNDNGKSFAEIAAIVERDF